jgi:transcriptional regulator with XRE-family HTH domain
LDQLAKEAGVSKGFLSAVENNRNQPSGRVLLSLAQALGASVDYLIQGEVPPGGVGDAVPASARVVEIPEELAALAERENWPFTKVKAVLNARLALHAKRSDRGPRSFTSAEWKEFEQLLAPYLENEAQ